MGYETNFDGVFQIDKPISPEQIAYLNAFAGSRRFKRDAQIAETLPDPVRKAVGLPIGVDGGYYVGSSNINFGQDKDESCLGLNELPEGQPEAWCDWYISEDGKEIYSDVKKFYSYTRWLEYIIEHFLSPWGYTVSGQVDFQGEENDDRGTIFVKDNIVKEVPDNIIPAKNPFE